MCIHVSVHVCVFTYGHSCVCLCVCVCVCVCVSCETHPVLEAGHTDGEQLHQPVELGEGHVGRPALDQGLVGVLHDPQETHQQVPAGLGRQGAGGLCCLPGRGRGETKEKVDASGRIFKN